MLPGRELPNDPDDNPCFGCGPRNPIGLRMRYWDDGQVVRSELTLSDEYCGWPGHVMSWIVLTALDEAIVWAAWARFGKLATETGAPPTWELPGRVATGRPFVVEARVVERRADGSARFEAVAVQDGEVRVRLREDVRPLTPKEAEELLARPGMPRTIREDAREILANRA
jgi:hypothetical protein